MAVRRVREIGAHAVWSLSSAKRGCGLTALLDPSLARFWQSEGAQPHAVRLRFPALVPISYVAVYIDVRQDETYTPSRLALRAG
ncbi:galactose-binding like protein, partial [Caulochytrium protostelioides]